MELSAPTLLKLGSFMFWSGLYLQFSWRYPGQSPEWRSRVVTLLHGSVATVVGLSQCGVNNLSKCRFTAQVLPQQYALMVWSWGYFAFDLLWCLLYWSKNTLMLFHHASSLLAITMYMEKDYTGCVFPCTLAMMEITNPLLQTRWFLKNEGCQKTFIYYIVEGVYLVLFITLRGLLGTYLIFKMLATDVFDLEEKLISCAIYFVSLAFLYEIYGYIRYKYKETIQGVIQQAQETSGVI